MNLRLKFLLSIGLLGLLGLMLPGSIRADTLNINSINANNSPFFVDIGTTNLLAQYGITLANVTPGTTVAVVCAGCAGDSIIPSSPPNVLTQFGNNNGMSYTLQFSTSLSTLSFNLAGNSKNGGSGTVVAAWSATAFNASGDVVSSVGDPSLFSTFSPFAPQPFTLTGPGIVSVTFFTQCFNFCGTLLNIADLSAPEIKLENATCQVSITNARMSDKQTLEFDVRGQFSQDSLSQKSIDLSTVINGTVVSGTLSIASGSTGTQSGSVFINLADHQVSRFTSNTQFLIQSTQKENQNSCSNTATAIIRLPVVIIPGILNDGGGDGRFPDLEAFLTALPPSSPDVLERPYQLRQNPLRQNPQAGSCGSTGTEEYPTLFTLSYDTSRSTLADGAKALRSCFADIHDLTYADKVSIVGHSKGGLVAREYLIEEALPTVDRLIMVATPNAGALKAAWVEVFGNSFVKLQDLLPVWPWERHSSGNTFGIPPNETNKELDRLNASRLPTDVTYTVIYSASEQTQETRTGKFPPFTFTFGSGDGVVPDFSAQGFVVDPNNNDETQIFAFVGIRISSISVPGRHRGYLQAPDVEQVIANTLSN